MSRYAYRARWFVILIASLFSLSVQAADQDFGDLPAPYKTSQADDGPRHTIIPNLRMGSMIDVDVDGAPTPSATGDDSDLDGDDEDGFDPYSVLPVPGSPLNYPIIVTTPAYTGALLVGFTDWNADGDFADPSESSKLELPAGLTDVVTNLPWNVPVSAAVGTNIAIRLRIILSGLPELGPIGEAASGEVEDYITSIEYDFGDLPDSLSGTGPGVIGSPTPPDYRTRMNDGGPYHGIRNMSLGPLTVASRGGKPVMNPKLALPGTDIDGEIDGQPSDLATGDDANGDDEDGLRYTVVGTEYSLDTNGIPHRDIVINFEMDVVNESGLLGLVAPFIDLNESGTMLDMRAYGFVNNVLGDGTQNLVTFGVGYVVIGGEVANPGAFTRKFAVRVRLSSEYLVNENGYALDGEVHDEIITVNFPAYTGTVHVLDFGDLPDEPYRTRIVRDGARHTVVSGLAIGATVDKEVDGVPDSLAMSDDLSYVDDEDGFDPSSHTLFTGTTTNLPVLVTTLNGNDALLYGYADWNNDGDFNDAEERRMIAVPPGLDNAAVAIPWSIPYNAVSTTGLALRLRIMIKETPGFVGSLEPYGYAPSGEVEDYIIHVTPALDFGDLPDAIPGTATGAVVNSSTVSQGDYQTRLADDGPRHLIRTNLSLVETGLDPIDNELDGQPSASADGDGTDEEGLFAEIISHIASNITAESIDISVVLMANLPVDNRTGSDAYLHGFIDGNNDGDFSDPGEVAQPTVPDSPVYTNVSLQFPLGWRVFRPTTSYTKKFPMRFRLSTEEGLGPNGPAVDGEVEDYIVTFSVSMGSWWGDGTTRLVVDQDTSARMNKPSGFADGVQQIEWRLGTDGAIKGYGATPLFYGYQLASLPAGVNPYYILAQRGDTVVDIYFGQLYVGSFPAFRSFAAQKGLSGENAAPDADADNDGRSNIDEYANGTDPSQPDEPVRPKPSIVPTTGTNVMEYSYLRVSGGSSSGATYSAGELLYQFSSTENLTNWSGQPVHVAPSGTLPPPPANYEWGAVRLEQTNSTPRGFILRGIELRSTGDN